MKKNGPSRKVPVLAWGLCLSLGWAAPDPIWLGGLMPEKPLNLKGNSADGQIIKGRSIDAQGSDYGIRLEGVQNLTIENCFITGAKQAGVMLKGCEKIAIRRCVFAGNGLRGIQLSSTGGNRDVVIESCEIYGATDDGIFAGEKKGLVDQPGLLIRRNFIHHVSSNLSWPGHYHGMYIQSAGASIEDNLVADVVDGNGISMRSSGIARGNTIVRVGKAGLAYFNDHPSGEDRLVIWESNTIFEVGRNQANIGGDLAPLRILDSPANAPKPRVETFRGRGNRIEKNKTPAFSSQWDPESRAGLEVLSVLEMSPEEKDPRMMLKIISQ